MKINTAYVTDSTFDGKTYYGFGMYTTKNEAEHTAKELRKSGLLARIVPLSWNYKVVYRNK